MGLQVLPDCHASMRYRSRKKQYAPGSVYQVDLTEVSLKKVIFATGY